MGIVFFWLAWFVICLCALCWTYVLIYWLISKLPPKMHVAADYLIVGGSLASFKYLMHIGWSLALVDAIRHGYCVIATASWLLLYRNTVIAFGEPGHRWYDWLAKARPHPVCGCDFRTLFSLAHISIIVCAVAIYHDRAVFKDVMDGLFDPTVTKSPEALSVLRESLGDPPDTLLYGSS